LDNFQT